MKTPGKELFAEMAEDRKYFEVGCLSKSKPHHGDTEKASSWL
jgi:hypothetical protein